MSLVAQAHWWDVPPRRQVSYLAGAAPDLLGVALDPLPDGAPAVVSFRPSAPGSPGSLRDQVAVVLRELDRAAVALFPHWLPGAAAIPGPEGLGVAAVRALAERAAARSRSFGPFLADLAERALRRTLGPVDRFPAEVRAAGLARVLATAYARDSVVVAVELPDGLSAGEERALTTAAEWLVQHSTFTVWLTGAPLHTVDRVREVWPSLPPPIAALPVAPGPIRPDPAAPRVAYPPLSGYPRADSPAELALERALAAHEWAHGRHWNHTYEPDILGRRYRLDLYWPAERLVVEVDGADHRQPAKFADDRRRDVHLQLHGNDVLRFTNEQVLDDVPLVLHHISQLLTQRRDPR